MGSVCVAELCVGVEVFYFSRDTKSLVGFNLEQLRKYGCVIIDACENQRNNEHDDVDDDDQGR
jgi:hypothetical protein